MSQSTIQPTLYRGARIGKWQVRVAPTAWTVANAEQLMSALFALPAPFQLIIEADCMRIEWYIVLPSAQFPALQSAVYAFYPDAMLELAHNVTPQAHTHAFEIHTADHFVQPLAYVSDHVAIDPLAALVAGLGQLTRSDRVAYELTLSPADRKLYRAANKQAQQSLIRWHHFLTPEGALNAIFDKAHGLDKTNRYRADLQRLVNEKLKSPLKRVNVTFRIGTANPQRTQYLATQLLPTLAPFSRAGSNYLVPAGKDTYPLAISAKEAAALWHLPSEMCQSPLIRWIRRLQSPMTGTFPAEGAAVLLGHNQYQGRTRAVYLPYADRPYHVSTIGRTGTGKSTFIHQVIHQDIQAGKGVGIIDPHGALAHDVLAASIPVEREKDVILFDVSDTEFPIGLNLLHAPPNVPAEVVAAQALSIIRKLFAESWSAARMEDALYAALSLLLHAPSASILDVHRLFFDSSFRASLLRNATDPVAREFWLHEYEPASASYQREIARPIANRIRKFYRNKRIRRIIAQPRSLDFSAILNNGKIFVANLGGLSDIESETLGALLISKFQVAAMSRVQQNSSHVPEFFLTIDEVQNFVTTSLPTVFSEARKYGLRLMVANQYLGQLRGRTLEAVLGNVGTHVIFGVGAEDARSLAATVQPQFTPQDLINLNRFHTVVRMQRQGELLPAFSMSTLPPLQPAPQFAAHLQRIRTSSRHQYARHRDLVDSELAERYQELWRTADTDAVDSDNSDDYFG